MPGRRERPAGRRLAADQEVIAIGQVITGRWNRLPALDRTVLLLYGSTPPSTITASAPAASAVRMIAPRLPGSFGSTRATIRDGPAARTVLADGCASSQTATRPCGVTVSESAAASFSLISATSRPSSRAALRSLASRVAKSSSTASAASASVTAWAPSARKRPVSRRAGRRVRRRAATSRALLELSRAGLRLPTSAWQRRRCPRPELQREPPRRAW